jgi:hypothetical protein
MFCCCCNEWFRSIGVFCGVDGAAEEADAGMESPVLKGDEEDGEDVFFFCGLDSSAAAASHSDVERILAKVSWLITVTFFPGQSI